MSARAAEYTIISAGPGMKEKDLDRFSQVESKI